MPIYEFLCPKCNVQLGILVRDSSKPAHSQCPVCGSKELKRIISRFAYHKSIKTIHEEAGEPRMFPSADYYKDPRNIGRWTEKNMKELGLEVPNQVQQMIQAARDGELPQPLKEL